MEYRHRQADKERQADDVHIGGATLPTSHHIASLYLSLPCPFFFFGLPQGHQADNRMPPLPTLAAGGWWLVAAHSHTASPTSWTSPSSRGRTPSGAASAHTARHKRTHGEEHAREEQKKIRHCSLFAIPCVSPLGAPKLCRHRRCRTSNTAPAPARDGEWTEMRRTGLAEPQLRGSPS